MSKTSSSLCRRLRVIFNNSQSTAVINTAQTRSRNKPRNLSINRVVPSTNVDEKKLKEHVENFKKSCESKRFRRAHSNYGAFVRRLAALRKFSMIDDVLQHQKKFSDIKCEGFVIRIMLLYGYAGMAEHAHKLFDEMPQLKCGRTSKSFNALLSAYVESSKFDESSQILRDLPEKLGMVPDVVSYNTIIKAFCRRGSLNCALTMFGELEEKGVEPNLITFNTMFESFYKKGWFSEGDKLWDLMESKSLVPDIRSYNSRIRGLVIHRKIQDVILLFNDMKAKGTLPDTDTFNALLFGYRRDDELDEAMRCYRKLKEIGLLPDSVTYCMIIPLLCKRGDLDTAFKVSKEAIENKVLSRPAMFKPVIKGLVNGGKVDEAMELVKSGKLQSYFLNHVR